MSSIAKGGNPILVESDTIKLIFYSVAWSKLMM
jgi:hypothetical protein